VFVLGKQGLNPPSGVSVFFIVLLPALPQRHRTRNVMDLKK
jgi:hypothetical protein